MTPIHFTLGLCRTWHDLCEAAEGRCRYGGDTAEVYALHFIGWRAHGHDILCAEYDRRASDILAAILTGFLTEYERDIEVDGQPFLAGQSLPPNGHRWHVRVFGALVCRGAAK